MSDWNKQASRNNNVPPNLNITDEAVLERKITNNIREQVGIEPNEQEELITRPQPSRNRLERVTD